MSGENMTNASTIYSMGRRLYSACLVGNPCPSVARMYERMTHPEPGDLCIEVTKAAPATPVGHLVGFDLDPDGNDITVIREPDGSEVRWGNCQWVAVDWPSE